MPVDVDESARVEEPPERYVQRLACEKAEAGFVVLAGSLPVLGADTAVVVDGRVLGKPADVAEAGRMLRLLAGREHIVLSAVALCGENGTLTALSRSQVWMRPIGEPEVARYCASGEPMDKAGGYAIQGRAAVFVERLEGSYSGVMGLPLYETAALLAAIGIDVLEPR